jgi:U3 small nucleolar RNA-associated protein 14
MSDDESINSDEIPSDKSSDSSNEEEKHDKALSKLKKTLNLENNNTMPTKKNNEDKNNSKIYFFENTSIKEGEKNVQTTKTQKIDFSDVFRTFQGDIKNETSRANLSRAVKNFGIKEKEKEGNNKKEVNKLREEYLEKEEFKRIERETSYLNVGNEISKYQPRVKAIREADVVDFTQDNKKSVRHIGSRTVKEIAKNININKNKKNKQIKDDLNAEIEKILKENNCVCDEQILNKEKEELKNINPEELERRYKELRQIRSRLFQKEIENRRKAKIKSKLYHKIKKNKRIKEENDLLEQLGQIDPDAVENYLNKKRIDRVQERMQLKHSLNSKFQKTIKKYHFDKDQQVKEAIKDNLHLRDKLLEKIEGKENENEISENEEIEQKEKNEENSEIGINEEGGKKVVVMNYEVQNKKNIKKINEDNNNKMGVFSMPFMKNAQENLDIQNKIEKLKNKLNNEEILDDYDKIEEKDSDNDSLNDHNKNKNESNINEINKNENKKNMKPIIITKDTINKINENTKKINENNDNKKKIDIKFDNETLQQMIDEENMNEDISMFNQFLVENDENKKEFLENENKEQLEEIKKNNPEFMPGWGTWAGEDPNIQAKEFLRKKRYNEKIRRLKEQANETNTNRFVVISNQVDNNFDTNYLVQDLPQETKNSEQFQKYYNTLIGREVNSLNLYRKLIQPKIIKKLGQIINPMTANDSTKGMQIQEIIEKVTKKKKFTKSKL